MRTQTENPPTTFTDFRTTGGFLEQGVGTSWERIVQTEITRRPVDKGVAYNRIAMVGIFLSSISTIALFLGEIYRRLDGALTGAQIGTLTPMGKALAASILVGVALVVVGRIASPNIRRR